MKPVRILIVGRPNVGKSALFNRLVSGRVAVVEEREKVTRDVKDAVTTWRGREFVISDSGGWLDTQDQLDRKVSEMVERFLGEADLVIFVVDVRSGITGEDLAVSRLLHRRPVPVRVVANKVDGAAQEAAIWEFLQLGFGDPIPVSAIHGRNSGDLLDLIGEATGGFQEVEEPEAGEAPVAGGETELKVAIVGRRNVGKSTLFNRMVGQERSVVFDLPGTTVDTVDTVIVTDDGPIRFFDTAGLRRRSKYAEATEYYSMVRTLAAIDAADVSILVIDASVGVTGWDQRLAERIDVAGSPLVLVMNKWDLLGEEERLRENVEIEDRLGFINGLTPIRVSARSGKGVHRILPVIFEAKRAYNTRIPTAELNRFMKAVQSRNPPSEGKILYAVQGASNPPTFTLFSNRPLPSGYLRFLENRMREEFGLGSTPVKLRVRRRD